MSASLPAVLTALVSLSLPGQATAGEWCVTGSTWQYCDFGCCSDSCCFLEVWMTGLIVVGCVIFVSIVIAAICCVVKSKGAAGRVVHPSPTTTTTTTQPHNNFVIFGHGQTGWTAPGPHGYGPHPPAYQPTAPPPPPSYYTDPVHPPPGPGQAGGIAKDPFARAAQGST